MRKLNPKELELLTTAERKTSISLYMPTHRKGKEIQQDPIRMKNLIREAKKQLDSLELDSSESSALLEQITSLPEDAHDDFWQHSSDGLAIFMQEGFTRIFRLPIEFDELVVVANRFHVKPLLSYLQGDGHFFVLAVSAKQGRLFEGGKHGLTEVDASDLPKNLNFDVPQASLQFYFHSVGGPGGSTKNEASIHGAGGESKAKDNLLKYFRSLDSALKEFFQDVSSPLVFAGVEYLFPIYQQANTYSNLMSESITGNKDDVSADELHKAAWEIVSIKFTSHKKELLEKYGAMAASDQGSNELTQAIKAAVKGRVDSLFLAEGVHKWGSISSDGSIIESEENAADNEDLLDHLAVQTLLHGGKVYLVNPNKMPTGSPLAALYRY